MTDSPVLALMKRLGLPQTRQNYLELAYLERRPYVSPEEEAELPAELPAELQDGEEDE